MMEYLPHKLGYNEEIKLSRKKCGGEDMRSRVWYILS